VEGIPSRADLKERVTIGIEEGIRGTLALAGGDWYLLAADSALMVERSGLLTTGNRVGQRA